MSEAQLRVTSGELQQLTEYIYLRSMEQIIPKAALQNAIGEAHRILGEMTLALNQIYPGANNDSREQSTDDCPPAGVDETNRENVSNPRA